MPQGTYPRCKADGCRKKALRRLYSTEMCALHYEQWRATLFDKDQWVCCRCHRQASTKWDGNSYCSPCYKVALNERYPKEEPPKFDAMPDPLTDYTQVQPSPEPNYYLKQLIREVITEELDKISAQKSDSQVDAIVEAIRSAMKGS